jgi:hypothetical protein
MQYSLRRTNAKIPSLAGQAESIADAVSIIITEVKGLWKALHCFKVNLSEWKIQMIVFPN